MIMDHDVVLLLRSVNSHMSGRVAKATTLYAVAILQGVCLVLIPAASVILKSPEWGGLTDQQYGSLVVAMVIMAIVSSALLKRSAERFGHGLVFYAGLLGNAAYLSALVATAMTIGNQELSFLLLLFGNLFLGVGFGLLVAVLNIFIVGLYPDRRDRALAGLHGCLGIGAALGPLLVTLFAGQGRWYLSALTCLVALGIVVIRAWRVGFSVGAFPRTRHVPGMGVERSAGPMALGAKLFLLMVIVYGCVEGMIAVWTMSYLHETKGLSMPSAALALSLFWGSVTVGRIATSLLSVRFNAAILYRMLPVGITVCLALIAWVRSEIVILLLYVAVGLSCSSFFPLSISLSTRRYDAWRESLSSLMITALMIGVGIGSYAIGYFRSQGWMTLNQAFLAGAGCAVVLALMALRLTRQAKVQE